MATEDRSFVNAGPREDRWFARSRHLWLVVLLTLQRSLMTGLTGATEDL